MKLTSDTKRRYVLTLDLDEHEALDLRNSIYEACASVPNNNWRSDPGHLREIQEELSAMFSESGVR